MRDEARQVVGVRVHLVAVPALTGTPMTATIVRDDAMPPLGEEECGGLPRIGVERPAMTEHDGRAAAPPVLVEDLGAVIGREEGHGGLRSSSSPC